MELQKPTNHNDLNKQTGKYYSSVDVEIQFQQEYPLHLKNCILSITQQHLIVIKYRNSEDKIEVKSNNLTLEIPFGSILCIGKKSPRTTLLMLKDDDKQIQRDQNGYELVSDDEEDEQFESKENPLFSQIKKSIENNESQNKTTRIAQKCNILLTINYEIQIQSNLLSSQKLYKDLSNLMEHFQQKLNQTNKNQWKQNLAHLEGMNFADGQNYLDVQNLDYGEQDENDKDYEDVQGEFNEYYQIEQEK